MRSCLAAASTPAWSWLSMLAQSPEGWSSQQVSASPAAWVDLSAVAHGCYKRAIDDRHTSGARGVFRPTADVAAAQIGARQPTFMYLQQLIANVG